MPNVDGGTGSLLSDIEILERLVQDDDEGIFISPLVDAVSQVGPSSLDLRLGAELRIPTTNFLSHIDLTAAKAVVQDQIAKYFRAQKVGAHGKFVLHPGEFALASTLEFVRLPRRIAGRLEGRSSLGRLGIEIHSTAGFVDPGFSGNLTLELSNVGKVPVELMPGLRVAQMCFFHVPNVQIPYNQRLDKKYGSRLDVELSKIYEDSDR